MNKFTRLYLISTIVCIAIALVALAIRLTRDRRMNYEFSRLTWGELSLLSVLMFVPALNVLIAGWWVFSPIWDGVEWVMAQMEKPVIRKRIEPASGKGEA